jgi:hypothetical protein
MKIYKSQGHMENGPQPKLTKVNLMRLLMARLMFFLFSLYLKYLSLKALLECLLLSPNKEAIIGKILIVLN